MSIIIVNAHQIGIDTIASNNFSLQTPTTPDGTLGLYRGNANTPLATIFTVDTNNNINFRNNAPAVGGRFQYTSTTVCTLIPYNGNQLNINGINYTIPAAGATLSSTGLTPSTDYNVYAWMNGLTMTLEASITGHSQSTTTGIEIKTGDPTRTLVGKVRPLTGPVFTNTIQNRLVISWLNQVSTSLSGNYASARNWGTATYTELDSAARLSYLAWANSSVQFNVTGAQQQNTAGAVNAIGCGFNSASVPGQSITQGCATVSSYYAVGLSQTFINLEGINFVTPLCWVNTGTGTFTLASSALIYT